MTNKTNLTKYQRVQVETLFSSRTITAWMETGSSGDKKNAYMCIDKDNVAAFFGIDKRALHTVESFHNPELLRYMRDRGCVPPTTSCKVFYDVVAVQNIIMGADGDHALHGKIGWSAASSSLSSKEAAAKEFRHAIKKAIPDTWDISTKQKKALINGGGAGGGGDPVQRRRSPPRKNDSWKTTKTKTNDAQEEESSEESHHQQPTSPPAHTDNNPQEEEKEEEEEEQQSTKKKKKKRTPPNPSVSKEALIRYSLSDSYKKAVDTATQKAVDKATQKYIEDAMRKCMQTRLEKEMQTIRRERETELKRHIAKRKRELIQVSQSDGSYRGRLTFLLGGQGHRCHHGLGGPTTMRFATCRRATTTNHVSEGTRGIMQTHHNHISITTIPI